MSESANPDFFMPSLANSVFRTCRCLTRSDDAALEAFQETFLAYARRKASLGANPDPERWLKETARRCSLAVTRSRKTRSMARLSVLSGEPFDNGVDPVDAAALSEVTSAFREEFGQLPPEDRDLLVMAYVDQLPHREIATILDCPVGSVHARSERARDQLRRRMERRGITIGILVLMFLLLDSKSSEAGEGASLAAARRSIWKKPGLLAQSCCVLGLSVILLAVAAASQAGIEPTDEILPPAESSSGSQTASSDLLWIESSQTASSCSM